MAATSSTSPVQYHLSFKTVPRVFLVHEKKECPIEGIPDSFFDILKETGKMYVEAVSKGMVFDITFEAGKMKYGPDVNKEALKIFLTVLNTGENNRAVYESMRISGLIFSIHLETEVLGEGNKSQGMATASMRFPHLLHHLSQKYRKIPNPALICIAGPGRKGNTSPIVAEMHMLFPEARLTLLEKNKEELQELWNIFQERGVTYDCSQLLVHSKPMDTGTAILDPRYTSFFHRLLKEIGGTLENITVSLAKAKDKIRPIRFDFEKQDLGKVNETYDIIIGTYSIIYPIKERLERGESNPIFPLILKFLKVLNPGGSMYIDHVTHHTLAAVYGADYETFAHQYLEVEMGCKLRFERIALSKYFPSIKGAQSYLDSITREHLFEGKAVDNIVSSSDIIEITRLDESSEMNESERRDCFEEFQRRDILYQLNVARGQQFVVMM